MLRERVSWTRPVLPKEDKKRVFRPNPRRRKKKETLRKGNLKVYRLLSSGFKGECKEDKCLQWRQMYWIPSREDSEVLRSRRKNFIKRRNVNHLRLSNTYIICTQTDEKMTRFGSKVLLRSS